MGKLRDKNERVLSHALFFFFLITFSFFIVDMRFSRRHKNVGGGEKILLNFVYAHNSTFISHIGSPVDEPYKSKLRKGRRLMENPCRAVVVYTPPLKREIPNDNQKNKYENKKKNKHREKKFEEDNEDEYDEEDESDDEGSFTIPQVCAPVFSAAFLSVSFYFFYYFLQTFFQIKIFFWRFSDIYLFLDLNLMNESTKCSSKTLIYLLTAPLFARLSAFVSHMGKGINRDTSSSSSFLSWVYSRPRSTVMFLALASIIFTCHFAWLLCILAPFIITAGILSFSPIRHIKGLWRAITDEFMLISGYMDFTIAYMIHAHESLELYWYALLTLYTLRTFLWLIMSDVLYRHCVQPYYENERSTKEKILQSINLWVLFKCIGRQFSRFIGRNVDFSRRKFSRKILLKNFIVFCGGCILNQLFKDIQFIFVAPIFLFACDFLITRLLFLSSKKKRKRLEGVKHPVPPKPKTPAKPPPPQNPKKKQKKTNADENKQIVKLVKVVNSSDSMSEASGAKNKESNSGKTKGSNEGESQSGGSSVPGGKASSAEAKAGESGRPLVEDIGSDEEEDLLSSLSMRTGKPTQTDGNVGEGTDNLSLITLDNIGSETIDIETLSGLRLPKQQGPEPMPSDDNSLALTRDNILEDKTNRMREREESRRTANKNGVMALTTLSENEDCSEGSERRHEYSGQYATSGNQRKQKTTHKNTPANMQLALLTDTGAQMPFGEGTAAQGTAGTQGGRGNDPTDTQTLEGNAGKQEQGTLGMQNGKVGGAPGGLETSLGARNVQTAAQAGLQQHEVINPETGQARAWKGDKHTSMSKQAKGTARKSKGRNIAQFAAAKWRATKSGVSWTPSIPGSPGIEPGILTTRPPKFKAIIRFIKGVCSSIWRTLKKIFAFLFGSRAA